MSALGCSLFSAGLQSVKCSCNPAPCPSAFTAPASSSLGVVPVLAFPHPGFGACWWIPLCAMTLTQSPPRPFSSSEQPDPKDQPPEATGFPHFGRRHRRLHHPAAPLRFPLMAASPLDSAKPHHHLPSSQPRKSDWGKHQTSTACSWLGLS